MDEFQKLDDLEPEGGAEVGGDGVTAFSYAPSGGAELGGGTVVTLSCSPSGGAELGGTAELASGYLPDGGLDVGGHASGSSTFEVSKEFSFSSGQCVPYHWQIIGTCQAYKCLTWNDHGWIPTFYETATEECKRRINKIVTGCTLQEVCLRLKEEGYNLTIEKIYRYTVPVLTRDNDKYDGCGTYIEVYPNPPPDIVVPPLPIECLEFLVTGTLADTYGMVFEAEFVGETFGEGGLDTTGEGGGDLSSYEMVGSGGLQEGEVTSSRFLGEFTVVAGATIEKLSIEPTFGEGRPGDELVAGSENAMVAAACNCGPFPLSLEITHNLTESAKFKYFLDRNGLTFPRIIRPTYNAVTFSWQANYHYRGYGDDGRSQELWDVLVEWACTDEFGGMITNAMWKFGVYVRQKGIGTSLRRDSRILLAFYPADVCVPIRGLRYSFSLNTEKKTVFGKQGSLNINADLNTCYDNIGLFLDDDWLSDPILYINLYQTHAPSLQQRLNINPLVPPDLIFSG